MNGKHNTHNTRDTRERGQAIVLIAFIMVALIGMLGLAVDGGGLLFLYRDARNATDASALAAAYAKCAKGDFVEAGLNAANLNGFNDDEMQNFVTVKSPPERGLVADDPRYIGVEIRAFKPSYFIQLLWPDALWVSTYATTYCRPAFNPATVPGLFGMGENCQQNSGTVNFTGAYLEVNGDIHSNDDLQIGGGGQTITINGDASAVDQLELNQNNVTVNGNSNTGVEPQGDPFAELVHFSDYFPGGAVFEALRAKGAKATFIDGDMDILQNEYPVLDGLYAVNGSVEFKPNWNGQYGPNGATIVAIESIEGQLDAADQQATYYNELITLNDNNIAAVGFVFYSQKGSIPSGTGQDNCAANNDNGAIVFTSDFDVTGVLYAPKGVISASFNNSDNVITGALVAQRVILSGAHLTLNVDPDLYPAVPPSVAVSE